MWLRKKQCLGKLYMLWERNCCRFWHFFSGNFTTFQTSVNLLSLSFYYHFTALQMGWQRKANKTQKWGREEITVKTSTLKWCLKQFLTKQKINILENNENNKIAKKLVSQNNTLHLTSYFTVKDLDFSRKIICSLLDLCWQPIDVTEMSARVKS